MAFVQWSTTQRKLLVTDQTTTQTMTANEEDWHDVSKEEEEEKHCEERNDGGKQHCEKDEEDKSVPKVTSTAAPKYSEIQKHHPIVNIHFACIDAGDGDPPPEVVCCTIV